MTASITKSCLAVSIALILLALFCIFNVQRDTSAFYLSAITLAINIVFSGVLIIRMVRSYIKSNRNTEHGNKS